MSQSNKSLFFILFISIALFLMNFVAIKTNLYWTTSWVDIVSHTLGGAMLGGVVIFLLTLSSKKHRIKLKHIFTFAIFVGIIWEYFEIKSGMNAITDPGYWVDTAGDIFFDTFGSYLASVFLTKNKF
jgi:hypothetical protein